MDCQRVTESNPIGSDAIRRKAMAALRQTIAAEVYGASRTTACLWGKGLPAKRCRGSREQSQRAATKWMVSIWKPTLSKNSEQLR
jgi:hypothetical protein